MFKNGRELTPGATLRADVCIIGAGPAGLALAQHLAATKAKVLVLESGGLEKHAETANLAKGTSVGLKYPSLQSARVRMFGGSSAKWAGLCRPYEVEDFQARPWVPHSGWPFDRAHLDPFYRRAHEFWGLGPYEYGPEHWSDEQHVPFDFRGGPVQNAVFQRVIGRRRLGNVMQDDFAKNESVDVCLWSNVREIKLNEAGTAVAHLDVRVLEGPEFRVEAKFYVLATGGLENPRVLLASNSVQKNGVGNQHDLVGRFFMEHPHHFHEILLVGGPKLVGNWDYYKSRSHGRGQNAHRVWGSFRVDPAHLEANELFTLQAVFFELGARKESITTDQRTPLLQREIERLAWHFDGGDGPPDLEAVENKFTFGILSEQEPNRESRVYLGDEEDVLGMRRIVLDWKMTDRDRNTVCRMHEMLAAAFARGGLGRANTRTREGAEWVPDRTRWGYHHMGTTRMNDDPKQGVCNGEGRVHGVENLWIAGASLFPTAGSSNPTLTIVALALRLADRLSERLA